ncbi:MAG TPA: aldo/keto reductase [Solirubrobacteraceae bacterium]|jgi:aryl-alcohol dehydrogenase-like predicted oxidoreductase|nr:aldo/keto reductase [Solirubrobacteraceae bacterium]
MDPTTTAIGTWSGGRFMHFGEPLEDERLRALVRPGDGIDTVITADAYGAGEADSLLGAALRGVDRDAYCLIGAIGHDFYKGAREGAKGYPRFTDARLRGPEAYADYIRMATERSLERLRVQRLDVLLLHNPDRTGYTSEAVWEGMAAVRDAGLTRMLGVAPGPANGFTLDVIDCIERYGELLDWAMLILSPLEPWPGELALGAAEANGVKVITRVVDYGGVFHDDVKPGHEFADWDHRKFRPAGWVERGNEKLERMRPYAQRHDLSMLQLACQWNLAHEAVRCVAPTLIQEARTSPGARGEESRVGRGAPPRARGEENGVGRGAPREIEEKRAELAALPPVPLLSEAEIRELRAIGDNTGSMALKGANATYAGEPAADRWALSEELNEVAARWEIAPERDLAMASN